MVSVAEKITLFNSVCISFRIGIILLLYFFPYPEMAILPGLIGLGFLYRSFIKYTPVGNFGSKVYWPRLSHAIIYITASILLLFKETRDYAFWVLVGDIIFGFIVFWDNYRGIKFNNDILKIN